MFSLSKSEINQRTMIICIVLIMFGLSINPYFNILSLIFAFGCMLYCGEEYYTYDLFFLLPFATVFKLSPNMFSLFTILQLGVVVLIIFKHKLLDRNFSLFLIMYTFYILLGSCFNTSQSIDITEVIKQISGILLLYFITSGYCDYDTEKILLAYSFGVLLSSFAAIFGKIIPNFSLYVRQIGLNSIITNRFSGLNGDPNYYAINLILVLMSGLFFYNKYKVLFWLLFGTCTYFGLQTYSRSFFLMWLVVVLFIMCAFLKGRRWRAIVTLILLAIIGFFALNKGNFHILSDVLKRLSKNGELGGITNGRTNLWKNYLTNITGSIEYIVFGHGFSSQLLNGMGPHNFYIEVWYYLGLVGAAIYVFLLARCVSIGRLTIEHSFVNVFPIISLIVMYFFLQMYFSNEFIFHVAIVYILSNTQFEM